MGWGETAATVGATLGSAYAAYKGARVQSRKGVKYSRQLRRTAYQDTMDDMAASGLNPILAYQRGATPATAVPTINAGKAAVDAASSAASTTSVAGRLLKRREMEDELLKKNTLLAGQQGYRESSQGAYYQHMAEKAFHESEITKMRKYVAKRFQAGLLKKGDIFSGNSSQSLMSLERLMNALNPFTSSAREASQALKNLSQ